MNRSHDSPATTATGHRDAGARPSTVLVVEDHAMMRDAVTESVRRTDGFVLLGAAASARDALAVLDASPADIVIVDLSLPDASGSELIAEIVRRWSSTLCFVLSGHREPHYVEDSRAAGARGYVVKGKPHEVAEALRAVAAGDHYYSRSLAIDG